MSDAHPEGFGPAEFLATSGVSRETLARLKLFISLLQEWNAQVNLVSANSLVDVWRRHVWDSAQLMGFVLPGARSLVDLGSGAGFPGLVLAAMLQHGGPSFRVVLYEATTKKCRFLEEVSRRLGLTVEIRNARMEEARREAFDIVTARACAPLVQLLSYAEPFQGKTTHCLFLKGQSVGAELTEAYKNWKMIAEQHPSHSDPSGVVLEIRELRRAKPAR